MAGKDENRIRQNLLDAGCSEELIARYFRLDEKGDKPGQKALLRLHRCRLLEEIHREQAKIDCLDYLVYTIEKNEREKE